MDDYQIADKSKTQDLELEDPDDTKHEESKPPSVTGEEDPFSGDATNSEPKDIDEELKNLGLPHDEDDTSPAPLGSELDEEAE